ncbi:hypothetical protein BH23GEM10_BH23GEM10_02520 [soil metagenome]
MFSDRGSDAKEVRRLVETLQVAALQSTFPGDAAAPLNKAGDLLLQSGDLRGALELYGSAVDSMIEADRQEAAAALCRKIIRTAPDVVRARCTLAWLAIGAGFSGELATRLVEYIAAAEGSGRQDFARQEVRRMGEHSSPHGIRLILGEFMLALGDDAAADELLGAVYRERNTGVKPDIDAQECWGQVRSALLERVAQA